ncbi:MAG: site-2 protease family protein [Candidatus Eisenbacteria bacterium]|uniref:Site-2 protease family protein n=1 Tax=Eiseniibacteriota bacterium TaxID=2212470 RepID=A0A849SRZ8_UNCEI|nr:site-2 protease family protein [Candidatus Eisenbacteria bacterium]
MTTPPGDDEARRRIENLRAVMAGAQPAASIKPAAGPSAEPHASHRKRNGILGVIGTAFVVIVSKLKFLGLLASVLKFKTLATMLLSIGLYAFEWGWAFAAGFVLLIFVHELGHAVVLKHEGIPAGAPVFIPFLGAFIAMRGMPRDAYVEAKVAIGGPVLGSLAAWAVLGVGLAMNHPLLVTLGHSGILLNLFNLIPVSPLDGGRIAGAFTRTFWIAGYVLGIGAFALTRSPILLIALAVGLITLWQRWRHPVPGYHDIPRAQRLAIGLGYALLLVALALTLPIGMDLHPRIAR